MPDAASFLLGGGDGGLNDCLDADLDGGLDCAFTSQADGASKRSAGIILINAAQQRKERQANLHRSIEVASTAGYQQT